MRLTLTRSWLALIALLSLCLQSCSHKQIDLPTPAVTEQTQELTIAEAKSWYQGGHNLTSNSSSNLSNLTSATSGSNNSNLISARLVWARALTAGQGAQKLVLVPLANDQVLFAGRRWQGTRYLVIAKKDNQTLDGNLLELLLRRASTPIDTATLFTNLYRSYHAGHVASPTQGEGFLILYTSDYYYIIGKHFRNGQLLTENVHLKFFPTVALNHAKNNSSTSIKESSMTSGSTSPIGPIASATNGGVCTDWYNADTGEYITTTGDCFNYVEGGSPDPTMPDGGGGYNGPGDYGGGGGGGGGGTGFTPASSSPSSVIVNASVHSDAKAECVLTKLLNNAQFNQLLKNFQNTSQYNVSFNMGPTNGATGQTFWDSATSTSIITIDKSSFDYQHAIWGASTFFHEAYHAQLQQFAIATYGTLAISHWPKPINDMTLQELIGCALTTASTASNPNWTSATHEFMAYNNQIMAEGLRDFVQTNYPQTYSQIGSDITKYNYLSLMGLESTERFKNEVVNQNKMQAYQQAISDFITGERPDCL